MKAQLPKNESARIEALHAYAILDTLEEQEFDDIVNLASLICDTPIALMSLVDSDRQWFKARVGLQAMQIPREHAFCAHAILRPDEVMVMNDARSDFRFSDNPLVTGDPRIRFYAGAPLVTATGDALGALCVIDRTPRDIATGKIEGLRALSRMAVSHMDRRRGDGEMDQNVARLSARLRKFEGHQGQLEAANAQLQSLIVTDVLTGVKNRRAYDQALTQELARASRESAPVSLLIIDIDNFKAYNDSFGHIAGDAALRQVAQTLATRARPFDVVARYGGEEFAVILPHTNAYGAVTVAERLRRAVEDRPWENRPITISIGVSTSLGETDGATMADRADRALYWMKRSGGNQVAHANQNINDRNP